MYVFGYLHIESGIVDKYDHVGLPLTDVVLAETQVAQDGGKMEEYRYEPHIGQVTVMLYPCAADSSHEIAAEETEVGLGVYFFQRLHQTRGVEVARCFSYNQIVLHESE
jgi:hypothetical protein